MANTATATFAGNTIELVFAGTGADWNIVEDMSLDYIKLKTLVWRPSGDGDILVINEGGDDGPSIVNVKSGADNTDQPIVVNFGEGMWCTPYIDITDCTFSDITATKIIFNVA